MSQGLNEKKADAKKLPPRSFITAIFDILLCRGDIEPVHKNEFEPVAVKELFRFATTRDKWCLMIGAVCAVVGGAIQPFVLVLGGFILTVYLDPGEKVANEEFWNDVMYLIIWIGITGICALIISFIQSFLLYHGSLNVMNSLRRQYLAAVLRQDATWLDQNASGVITSQLNDNIARIQDGMGDKMGLLIRGFSMFFSSIVTCSIINWQTTFISITAGPIAAMTMALLGKVNSASLGSAMKLHTEAASIVEESVMNVKTVQSCNGEEHMVKKYRAALSRALPYSIYVVIGAALWFGCYGFFHHFVNERGDVVLCVSTTSMTAYFLGMLGPHMMALFKARVAAAVIYDTIDRAPSTNRRREGYKKEIVAGHVVFKDVYFSYSTRNQSVLNGLSWEAPGGETIALVGASGSGKSTSVSLLSRLYEVNDGKIALDGVPLSDYDVEELRKRIGIVQQEPYLFHGTVKENISLGRDGIDDEKIRQAAEIANVTEFVNRLEKGFDTCLGAGGVILSGGQKQRIAIARAIAANPRILFLDEATSALDANSEKIVQMALNKAAKGRTTVVIAHRLSTIRDVKKIYVIEKGKVVETGSHDELMEKGGVYARLATAQQFQNTRNNGSSEQLGGDSRDLPAPRRPRVGSLHSALFPVSDSLPSSSFNEKTSGGLCLLYRNMKGSYLLATGCLIVAAVRALELPGLGLAYLFAFKSLQMDEITYRTNALYALLASCACGAVIWLAQCTSSAIEIIEQARSIKLAVVEKYFLRKYIEHQQMSTRIDFWIGFIEALNFAATQSFVFFSDMSCYLLVTWLIYQGVYTTETVYMHHQVREKKNCRNMLAINDRKEMTVVKFTLKKGTILENVLLGADTCSKDDAIEACRLANASKFIESLPERYNTNVGEKGRLLSGGQKQRIAIARALVRKPRILLLDEATSALDAQSEQVVQQALDEAKLGRTAIIVAHRISSVQTCDRILYIDHGMVAESGTHSELMELNGKYAELVRAQDLNACS
ncbi:hypothetical protein GCK32_002530 [Trichostrongylus colubriformis]|uniref:Uncharacterized protein n=1 Tax=Trichostrongylus colubriformis TaxID=6319 RepID=A0AAN8GEN5_TRICO